MTAKVFIDGEVGTTGLQIRSRLAGRRDIALLSLPEDRRKDPAARREMLNAADLVVLCLPDDAAREAVSLIENPAVRVIDASTAHRTAEGWTYGFPEYEPGHADKVAAATRVSNPGCYALSAVAILHPLVSAGLLAADWPVTINAISGYSGGGKKLIAAFEDPTAADHTETAFRVYALTLKHKHLPEITKWSGLSHQPVFVPSVGRYAQGMIVQVPLPLWAMPAAPSVAEVHATLAAHYAGTRFVSLPPLADTAAMDKLEPEGLNGTNQLRLHVFGDQAEGQLVVMALIDNLGKGASGQAVQNLNLMLGRAEDLGLE
jgi:N-acetyl-gamma-glutamyl-phosphate reductase